jgi:hypothetical protein
MIQIVNMKYRRSKNRQVERMKKSISYTICELQLPFCCSCFGFAIDQGQILIGLAVLAAGFAILQVLRVRYKSVILADERTKRIAEKPPLELLGSDGFWNQPHPRRAHSKLCGHKNTAT